MRSRVIQVVILAVVMVCLWAHISELFDTWDHTLETGNEIESTLAAVALCVGASVVFMSVLFRLFCKLLLGICPSFVFQQLPLRTFDVIPILLSPSPPPLRV